MIKLEMQKERGRRQNLGAHQYPRSERMTGSWGRQRRCIRGVPQRVQRNQERRMSKLYGQFLPTMQGLKIKDKHEPLALQDIRKL